MMKNPWKESRKQKQKQKKRGEDGRRKGELRFSEEILSARNSVF